MASHSRIPGDPLRQFLVGVPLGLLVTSAALDIVTLRTGDFSWAPYAWAMLYTGITMAVIALPFTLVDVQALRSDGRLHGVRRLHELLHAVAVLLFLGSWALRDPNAGATGDALRLSLAGAVVALVAASFGDELVLRMRTLHERRRSERRADPARQPSERDYAGR